MSSLVAAWIRKLQCMDMESVIAAGRSTGNRDRIVVAGVASELGLRTAVTIRNLEKVDVYAGPAEIRLVDRFGHLPVIHMELEAFVPPSSLASSQTLELNEVFSVAWDVEGEHFQVAASLIRIELRLGEMTTRVAFRVRPASRELPNH